jgi:hypothetical protein
VAEPCTFPTQKIRYELRFTGLSDRRRDYAFPCDEAGRVDIDKLTDRSRMNYFYARTVVGKELSAPVVAALSADPRTGE